MSSLESLLPANPGSRPTADEVLDSVCTTGDNTEPEREMSPVEDLLRPQSSNGDGDSND